MEEVLLKATRRDVVGKQVRALRRQGKLPAVLYGRGLEPINVTLNLHETSMILARVASSALITVDVDGERHMALIREKQRDFIRGSLKHLDFQVVSMREKLRVEIAVSLVGEAPAVKDFNGVPVTGMESIEVECLPGNLPDQITVDISTLKNIGDAIYLRDLTPPDKVEFLEDPDEMIVLITAPAAEEVEPGAPEETGAAEPEVITRGKKEDEDF